MERKRMKLLCKIGLHDWEFLEKRLSRNVYIEMIQKGELSKSFTQLYGETGISYQSLLDRKVCMNCEKFVDEIQVFKDFVLKMQKDYHNRLGKAHKVWQKVKGEIPLVYDKKEVKDDVKVDIVDPYFDDEEGI
jgi:hypothetical protein